MNAEKYKMESGVPEECRACNKLPWAITFVISNN
jgi:hypothetical protein